MGKPASQTRLSRDARRAEIIEAAGRLFGEHGYDGVRLEDIAAANGVTKPILYRHFESKQALYLALLDRHRDDLGSFSGAIPPEGPIEHRMRAVLDVWLDYVESHSYAWKMLFRDSGGGLGDPGAPPRGARRGPGRARRPDRRLEPDADPRV